MLGAMDLTYIIKDEVLLITTKEKADTELVTKAYPVADLVIPIRSMHGHGRRHGRRHDGAAWAVAWDGRRHGWHGGGMGWAAWAAVWAAAWGHGWRHVLSL